MKRRDFIKTLAVSGAGAALSFNSIPIKALGFNSVLGKILEAIFFIFAFCALATGIYLVTKL